METMTTDEVLRELFDRMARGQRELMDEARRQKQHGSNVYREGYLTGKAAGLGLAMDYLRAHRPVQ